MRLMVVPLAVTLLVSACARLLPPMPSDGRVRGVVTYRERVALPPEAVVYVSLEDTTRADMPIVLLAGARIEPAGGQVPIPFELTYDPQAVSWGRTYELSAAIAVGGMITWRTGEGTRVLTGDDEAAIDLVVQRVEPTPLTGEEPR
jgi:putative lipoprotein